MNKEDFVPVGTPAWESIGMSLFVPAPPRIILVFHTKEKVAVLKGDTPFLTGVAKWEDSFLMAGWRPLVERYNLGGCRVPLGKTCISWRVTPAASEGQTLFVLTHQLSGEEGWKPAYAEWVVCPVFDDKLPSQQFLGLLLAAVNPKQKKVEKAA